MPHFLQRFLNKDWFSIEEVNLVVEKDTKKAVNELITQLNELLKTNYRIINVDARVLKKKELVAVVVAYSLHFHRNIGSLSFRVVRVTLDENVPLHVNDSYFELYMKLKLQGGGYEEYAKQQGFCWYTINAIINAEFEKILTRLKEAQRKIEPIIEMGKGVVADYEYKRRWNFHTQQTTLSELYRRCFDEFMKILSPHSSINPNPSFQRNLVWSEAQKISFIQSVVNEIPIGTFYVNKDRKYDPYLKLGEGYGSLLWDGKQRLHAMDGFLKGDFPVLIDKKEVYYHQNPIFFASKFNDCYITVYESEFTTLREIIEAYVVINLGLVKHTDEDLQKAINYLQEQGQSS